MVCKECENLLEKPYSSSENNVNSSGSNGFQSDCLKCHTHKRKWNSSYNNLHLDITETSLDTKTEFNDCDLSQTEFSDLDTGWAWVELAASFGCFVLLGNAMLSIGIIHSVLLDRYGQSVAVTSWAGALHSAMFSLAGPLSSAIIEKYSCRTTLVLSGILFVLGYITTAFAPNIEVAIFTCGIIAGTGGGLCYTASMVVVNFNFKKRRNIALGIASAGVGAGLFFIAPVVQYARQYYGNFGLFFIVSCFLAHIVVLGMLCFPSKLERYSQLQRNLDGNKLKSEHMISGFLKSLKSYVKILRNKGILCLCMSMFLFCGGVHLVYLHLPNYITSKGFSALEAAYLVSISGIVAILGRILTGIVASRIDEIIPYAGSMCIVAIITFIYPYMATYYAGHVSFVVIYGLFFGSSFTIIPTVSLKFVDIHYVSTVIGMELFFGGIGALLLPVLAGILVDNGGSYGQSFIVTAFCFLLAAIASVTSLCFKKASVEIMIHMPAAPEPVEPAPQNKAPVKCKHLQAF